jgi:hypothetical protein
LACKFLVFFFIPPTRSDRTSASNPILSPFILRASRPSNILVEHAWYLGFVPKISTTGADFCRRQEQQAPWPRNTVHI